MSRRTIASIVIFVIAVLVLAGIGGLFAVRVTEQAAPASPLHVALPVAAPRTPPRALSQAVPTARPRLLAVPGHETARRPAIAAGAAIRRIPPHRRDQSGAGRSPRYHRSPPNYGPHTRGGTRAHGWLGDHGLNVPSPLRPHPRPHPAYVSGPLTGLRTSWDLAHRRPLAVMVENYDPDSRPQTGLNSASLVFETVAEGGITRFMAVYLEHDAPVVGPVRSARVYFNAWANGLHAILVHAGGNDDALAQLFTLPNIADLNEVAFEDANYIAHVPYFSRSPLRLLPHNLYTYPPLVREHMAKEHVALSGDFPDALPHRRPDAPAHRPAGGVLDLNFSTPSYAVEYRYDHATNRYARWMGGAPHVDAATGHQIAPSNVVVLLANIAPDPYGGGANPGAVYVQCTGKGRAYLFRDGYQYVGTWHKAHGSSPLKLLDAHGRPFAFNPGSTWIEVLPATGSMSWTSGRR